MTGIPYKDLDIDINYVFMFLWYLGYINEKTFIVSKWRQTLRGKVKCYSGQRLIGSNITFRAFVTNKNGWSEKGPMVLLSTNH